MEALKEQQCALSGFKFDSVYTHHMVSDMKVISGLKIRTGR